jgi:hypothetical protein
MKGLSDEEFQGATDIVWAAKKHGESKTGAELGAPIVRLLCIAPTLLDELERLRGIVRDLAALNPRDADLMATFIAAFRELQRRAVEATR